MNRAVSEVKALSGYNVKGEVSSENRNICDWFWEKGHICTCNINVVVLRYRIHLKKKIFWA